MQRTVIATKFTYVSSYYNEDNEVVNETRTVEVLESDTKKALKKAKKLKGEFIPIKVEKPHYLYKMDDEKFLQLATREEI